jgi:very-short-patch-repair endonuclease
MHRRQLTFARNLRSEQTSAELKLWYHLRRRGISGLRFNRQFSVGPYIVDFICREKAFIIEVDGATHVDQMDVERDRTRTAFLISQGFQVYRVNNIDIYENIEGVLDGLLLALEQVPSKFARKGPHRPSGEGGPSTAP